MRSFSRTACATLAVLTLIFGFSRSTQAQQSAPTAFRMAFVNTNVLLDNAPGKTQAESTYARETRAYGDQLKKMSDSLNAMFTSYQKQEPTLTATQKETRQKALRDLQQQLQDKQQQLTQQAQQRQTELMAPIMEQVKKVLDDIRTGPDRSQPGDYLRVRQVCCPLLASGRRELPGEGPDGVAGGASWMRPGFRRLNGISLVIFGAVLILGSILRWNW